MILNKSYITSIALNKSLIVLTLLLIQLSSAAQNDNADFLVGHFQKYKEQTLQEKLFVHTDQSDYLAGEIMWFKVYCIDENNSKLLTLSKVAYVEILDKNQQPVMQAKVELKDGTGGGSIAIPSNIPSGNYIFRSYTNWMKNFDANFYFQQPITIINTIQSDAIAPQKITDTTIADFFPEGGELVDGLESKVAFKVTDIAGKGIDFKGVVFDETKNAVVQFSPSKFGIGNFNFTPLPNKHYSAFITTPNGKTTNVSLPAAINTGMVISATDKESNGKLTINIKSNNGEAFAYLFIYSANAIKLARRIDFNNEKAKADIDIARLGEGISHIVLFNKNYDPLCERLYFKKPQQHLLIEAKTESKQFLTRKKVTIDLSSADENNSPAAAEISMSVHRADSPNLVYSDIYNYLWLSSDLKGNIESPEYYVNSNEENVLTNLDNLMLTHGWRKFKWNGILRDEKKALRFLPEYEGHLVTGKVFESSGIVPAANQLAFLSVPGTNFQLYTSTSRSDGTVCFNTKNFYGNKLMVALVKPEDSTTYKITVDNPFSESFSSYVIPPFNPSQWKPEDVLRRSINMQVQRVYRGHELQNFEQAKEDTMHFYGKPDVTYMLEDYVRFPTMEEVLREYVREIEVKKKEQQFFIVYAS